MQVTTFELTKYIKHTGMRSELQSCPQPWKRADEKTAMSNLSGPRFRLSEGAAMTSQLPAGVGVDWGAPLPCCSQSPEADQCVATRAEVPPARKLRKMPAECRRNQA